jgi:hypothetical protein
VEPVLIATLERDVEDVTAKYPIVCTTLFHFAQVKAIAGSHADKVVAVHCAPDSHALLELSSLGPGSAVGVVCEQPGAREYLSAAIGMVFEGVIQECLMSEGDQLAEIARSVDILVDVPSCHARIAERFPSVRTLTVSFHLDNSSLSALRDRLAELGTQRAREVTDGLPTAGL